VSFCYEDHIEDLENQYENLKYLQSLEKEQLENITIGVDRGVKRPVQAGTDVYDFTIEQKRKKLAKERYIKRCQKRLAKQQKTSKRRKQQKRKLARASEKIANIRKDFCHKTSRSIVDKESVKVIIFEDLKTKQMTKRPKAKKNEQTGKWAHNHSKSKAGLNKAILDKGWCQMETFVKYKAHKAGKAVFKVSAHHTSQECADCGHIHPNNRKTQTLFHCESCGHSDNADHNAAEVIKKRAINLIHNSGTELSSRGVLLDSGRGAADKSRLANVSRARGKETSKKKILAASISAA
jgi:putative transposase